MRGFGHDHSKPCGQRREKLHRFKAKINNMGFDQGELHVFARLLAAESVTASQAREKPLIETDLALRHGCSSPP